MFARNTPMSFDRTYVKPNCGYPPAGTIASILARSLTHDFCMVAMGTGCHLIQPWSICGLMDKPVASFGVSISHYLIRKCMTIGDQLRKVSPGQPVGWAAKRAASGLQLAASAMSGRHEETATPALAFHTTPPLSPALGSIIEAQIIISFTSIRSLI